MIPDKNAPTLFGVCEIMLVVRYHFFTFSYPFVFLWISSFTGDRGPPMCKGGIANVTRQ